MSKLCVSALMVFRGFYEATRNLDSQPPPRSDHVEASRPRGLCLSSEYSFSPRSVCHKQRRGAGGGPAPGSWSRKRKMRPVSRPCTRPRPAWSRNDDTSIVSRPGSPGGCHHKPKNLIRVVGKPRNWLSQSIPMESSGAWWPAPPAPLPVPQERHELERALEPPGAPRRKRRGVAGVVAAIVAFLAKFKALIFLLPKLKLLTTAGTMLVS